MSQSDNIIITNHESLILINDNESKTSIYNKEYYKKNKQHILEYKKEFYFKNKEEILKDRKEYRDNPKNKEEIAQNDREYKKENKEQIAQKNKEYSRKLKSRFNKLKSNAKSRGLECLLTFDQYEKIIINNCYYCNNQLCNPVEVGSGIDRLDSNKGYLINNVVSCGKICNVIKMDQLTPEETKVMIKALLEYRASNVK